MTSHQSIRALVVAAVVVMLAVAVQAVRLSDPEILAAAALTKTETPVLPPHQPATAPAQGEEQQSDAAGEGEGEGEGEDTDLESRRKEEVQREETDGAREEAERQREAKESAREEKEGEREKAESDREAAETRKEAGAKAEREAVLKEEEGLEARKEKERDRERVEDEREEAERKEEKAEEAREEAETKREEAETAREETHEKDEQEKAAQLAASGEAAAPAAAAAVSAVDVNEPLVDVGDELPPGGKCSGLTSREQELLGHDDILARVWGSEDIFKHVETLQQCVVGKCHSGSIEQSKCQMEFGSIVSVLKQAMHSKLGHCSANHDVFGSNAPTVAAAPAAPGVPAAPLVAFLEVPVKATRESQGRKASAPAAILPSAIQKSANKILEAGAKALPSPTLPDLPFNNIFDQVANFSDVTAGSSLVDMLTPLDDGEGEGEGEGEAEAAAADEEDAALEGDLAKREARTTEREKEEASREALEVEKEKREDKREAEEIAKEAAETKREAEELKTEEEQAAELTKEKAVLKGKEAEETQKEAAETAREAQEVAREGKEKAKEAAEKEREAKEVQREAKEVAKEAADEASEAEGTFISVPDPLRPGHEVMHVFIDPNSVKSKPVPPPPPPSDPICTRYFGEATEDLETMRAKLEVALEQISIFMHVVEAEDSDTLCHAMTCPSHPQKDIYERGVAAFVYMHCHYSYFTSLPCA
eukprot:gnl/Hemi2/1428_TR500_c0_g1_i2.p1 gnl/Hemi2/1428_TR500_c0_g1~~gnl/Hemi2/1428_TR500_c0_g1_i2.p1  ORF type:complete len:709 (-),score=293.55 gnl/Hemi2/1428_TR500_c0_g1_i2:89-2215(-)